MMRRNNKSSLSKFDLDDLKSILKTVKAEPSFPESQIVSRSSGESSTARELVDLDAVFNVSKLPIVSVEVRGHVSDEKQFQRVVIDRGLRIPEIAQWKHKFRLVLDLRKVFFIRQAAAFKIMDGNCRWLRDTFERICVVMPRCYRIRNELYQANIAFKSQSDNPPEMPPTRVVERARDVKEYIEPTEIPRAAYAWPNYSPTI
jgi:hypothetical protein